MRRTVIILMLTVLAACTGKDAETRAREAERKVKESIPDVVGAALAQKASPDQIKQAQQDLKVLSEYLGEPTGTLDAVTVSAIQAFQRTQGLKADGMLTGKTLRLLQEAAGKAQPQQS
ncbi:MAG TPA: peptidoglycan-binding domain-containing protein [Candidatus Margulisiibacteriota bacterium]|nr:peptidoglycan-binding domain-containing protein [Candidatus Margulisiibacteriota bacterium]